MLKNAVRIMLCSLLILGLYGSSPALAAPDPIFDEVKAWVENFYVDPVDVDSWQVHSSREIMDRLGDPFSAYFTAAEFEDFMGSIDGQYAGIGVYLDQHMLPEGIPIKGTMAGSPAEAAGLQEGDVIVGVNHQSLRGLDIDTVCTMLLGAAGSAVELEVQTGEGKKSFTLLRQLISMPVVSSACLGFNTAYIDIDSFSEEGAQDLVHTMQSCQEAGADKWILDLRGNPGGYIDAAIEMAGIFVGQEVVSVLEERNAIINYYPEQPEFRVNDPLLILIDQDSASASEILAAALKDYHRAVLLGGTSYGKGTVQELYPLSNGDWLKLTTARFYSPLGMEINHVGVSPDLTLEGPDMIKAAELLLSDPEDGGRGNFELLANGHIFQVDLALARSPQYWEAWGQIIAHLDYLPAYLAAGASEYNLYTPTRLQDRAALYFPQAQMIRSREDYHSGQDICLYISQPGEPSWNTENIEIWNAGSGDKVEADLELMEAHLLKIKPAAELLPGEYWIVFKDGQKAEFLATIGNSRGRFS